MDGNVLKVKKLIELGCSLDAAPGIPETPLELACRLRGKPAEEILNLLLAYGADIMSHEQYARVFTYACTWGNLAIVRHLSSSDPEVINKTNVFGENAIHCASKNYSEGSEIIRFLLKTFNCFDLVWARDNDGLEPQLSMARLNCEILALIALSGGNLNDDGKNGRKYPSFAASCSSTELCPMRLAMMVLEKINFKFDQNISLELAFHEAHNRFLLNVPLTVQVDLDKEFQLITTYKLYGNQTPYNFLTSNRLQIENFEKNEDSIRDFLKNKKLKFYENLLESKLCQSIKRTNFREEAYEKFSILVASFLPQMIFEKVSLLCNNNELRKIIMAELEIPKKN